MSDSVTAENLDTAIRAIADKYDADVFAYVGFLVEPEDEKVIRMCRKRRNKRKNVLLILSTPGGSADAAYRIARCFQRCYRTSDAKITDRGQFLIYVHDMCASAGTILALGATRLIMSQRALLGPIDVQLRRDDEVGERRSGLTSRQALETLAIEAGRAFTRLFRHMRFDEAVQFPTKMAGELAAQMAVGIMAPIYAQIDPMRLGETERYVRISQEYGDRLRTSNVKKGTIERLLSGYPSHDFVIDREEAHELFETVDRPSDELETVAGFFIRNFHPTEERSGLIKYISAEPQSATKEVIGALEKDAAFGSPPVPARSRRKQARSGVDNEARRPHQTTSNGDGRLGKNVQPKPESLEKSRNSAQRRG